MPKWKLSQLKDEKNIQLITLFSKHELIFGWEVESLNCSTSQPSTLQLIDRTKPAATASSDRSPVVERQ
jgi:hypothetical protein